MAKMNFLSRFRQQQIGIAMAIAFGIFWCCVYYDCFINKRLDSLLLLPLAILPSSALSDPLIYALFDSEGLNRVTFNKIRFFGMLISGIPMFFLIGTSVSQALRAARKDK